METQYRTYHELLTEAKEDPIEIVTTEGELHKGWLLRADADSIGWADATDSIARILPTSRVQHLEITHHYNLWWLGGLAGLLGTTVPMVASGGWEPSDKGGHPYRLAVIGEG